MGWDSPRIGSSVSPAQSKIADGANLDAFSRLRVSGTTGIFDAQFTYDLQPLVYEQLTNGSGATITHSSTNRCALMTFSNTPTGGYAYMQSYEYMRYQPGKSQMVFVTFNFTETKTNVIKFAGYGDSTNRFVLELSGSTLRCAIYSGTSSGNQVINQSSWNLDPMNGLGPSGITLDITKGQILVVDFQALYQGRVRFGFDIGGVIIYCHEFLHANTIASTYIQYANLPIICGMQCSATVSTTMTFHCSSVISEGGQEDTAGYEFAQEGTATASSGARTHVLSIRPKTTFNSITNRAKYTNIEIDGIVTGTNPIYWELVVGQAISGTTAFNDVNSIYSGTEYNTAGTISGSPVIVIDSGYITASAPNKGTMQMDLTTRYPMTLNAAGAVRSLGTFSIIATGLGGSSACRFSLKWKEVR